MMIVNLLRSFEPILRKQIESNKIIKYSQLSEQRRYLNLMCTTILRFSSRLICSYFPREK